MTTNTSDVSVQITGLRADASGDLTQIGTASIAQTSSAALFSESSGHNLYATTSAGDVVTFTINPDGTLNTLGSPLHLAEGAGFLAVSPNGQLAYVTISNGSVKNATLTDATVVLNRDPNSGALTFNHQVNSQQHLFDLQFDLSGKYLTAIGGTADHINVYSVDYSTGDLTPVPGSPFASTSVPSSTSQSFSRTFRFDPSGKFIYLVNGSSGPDPRPENISVYSFNQATGTLVPIQTFDLSPGRDPLSVVADQSLVFVVGFGLGGPPNPSSVTILRRDPNTGMVNPGGDPVLIHSGVGKAGEISF